MVRTVDFEGHLVTAVWFRDRWCWPAAQVGEAIGYDEGRILVDKIRGDWAEEFREGTDYEALKGADLKEFREVSSESLETSKFAGRLVVLTESGIDTALLLARTEKGRRLRRMLVDFILPQLRATGTASLPGAPPALSLSLADVAKLIDERITAIVLPTIQSVASAALTSVTDLQKLVQGQSKTIVELQSEIASGVIGEEVAAKEIVERLRYIARLRSTKTTFRGERKRWENKLRNLLCFNGPGSKWMMMPRELLAVAQRQLSEWEREAVVWQATHNPAQMPLFEGIPQKTN